MIKKIFQKATNCEMALEKEFSNFLESRMQKSLEHELLSTLILINASVRIRHPTSKALLHFLPFFL